MSRSRAYAQLVRLPALPTAFADIGLGALATSALPARWPVVALLAIASGCLYCSGMVLNDYFDLEQDRRERPERPLPSGRVSQREAGFFGAALLGTGLCVALLADLARLIQTGALSFLATRLALALAAAILLYDGWLKRTVLGPVSMGLCRFLNVLLGVSAAGTLAVPVGPHLAGVVGLYIVGVTWLARTEARVSSRSALAGAAVVLLAALAFALPLPLHRAPEEGSPLFPYLLVVLGFLIGLPVLRALERPVPQRVQAAVGRCLFCLIILDAVLATALTGAVGLVLLVLLAPALLLARRRTLYAT
jgi:4-hydroxybenzoate polyprenyltransferase